MGIALTISQCRHAKNPSVKQPKSVTAQIACSANGYSAKYYEFKGDPYQTIILDNASMAKFDKLVGDSGNQALTDIQQLTCLEELWIHSSWKQIDGRNTIIGNITNLNPLTKLTQLKSLWLGDIIGVSDFSPLSALTNLTDLIIRNSPIVDLSPLGSLVNLRSLAIQSRQSREWTQEKVAPNIAPLANLANLEFLAITLDTPIDLTPLYNLKHLRDLIINGDWAGLDVDSKWLSPTKKTSYPPEIINLKKALPQLKIDFGESGLIQNLPTNFIQ